MIHHTREKLQTNISRSLRGTITIVFEYIYICVCVFPKLVQIWFFRIQTLDPGMHPGFGIPWAALAADFMGTWMALAVLAGPGGSWIRGSFVTKLVTLRATNWASGKDHLFYPPNSPSSYGAGFAAMPLFYPISLLWSHCYSRQQDCATESTPLGVPRFSFGGRPQGAAAQEHPKHP